MDNEQRTGRLVVAISVAFVMGTLLASWFAVAQRDPHAAEWHAELEQVSAQLTGFDAAFGAMRAEIRQLKYAVADATGRMLPPHPQTTLQQDTNSSVSPGDEDHYRIVSPEHANDGLAQTAYDLEQETANITMIVDRLQARDVSAYPDFPSLMNSPEMNSMSPQSKDRVMAEIARLFESGQLEPTFFPGKQ